MTGYLIVINEITNFSSLIESRSWSLYWRTPAKVQIIFHIRTDLNVTKKEVNAPMRNIVFPCSVSGAV